MFLFSFPLNYFILIYKEIRLREKVKGKTEKQCTEDFVESIQVDNSSPLSFSHWPGNIFFTPEIKSHIRSVSLLCTACFLFQFFSNTNCTKLLKLAWNSLKVIFTMELIIIKILKHFFFKNQFAGQTITCVKEF